MDVLETVAFATPDAWEAFLEREHATSRGVWLRIAKKGCDEPSVRYEEALAVALCFGWIDGQKRPLDERFWLQRFTPRGPRSLWSRVNVEHANRLIAEQRMRPAGLATIERARADGRWQSAYSSSATASVPDDLAAALAGSPGARAFFEALDRTNRYAILYRLETARRPETRARHLARFVAMLEAGERIHP
jgi:uncharacterized protein YdeI (YjbR/CyaY-like superfamily)